MELLGGAGDEAREGVVAAVAKAAGAAAGVVDEVGEGGGEGVVLGDGLPRRVVGAPRAAEGRWVGTGAGQGDAEAVAVQVLDLEVGEERGGRDVVGGEDQVGEGRGGVAEARAGGGGEGGGGVVEGEGEEVAEDGARDLF